MGRQGPWAHRPDIRGAAVQGVGRGPEGRHETGGLRGAVRRLGQLRPQMAQDHRGRTRAVPAGPPQIHTGIHIEIRHQPPEEGGVAGPGQHRRCCRGPAQVPSVRGIEEDQGGPRPRLLHHGHRPRPEGQGAD